VGNGGGSKKTRKLNLTPHKKQRIKVRTVGWGGGRKGGDNLGERNGLTQQRARIKGEDALQHPRGEPIQKKGAPPMRENSEEWGGLGGGASGGGGKS